MTTYQDLERAYDGPIPQELTQSAAAYVNPWLYELKRSREALKSHIQNIRELRNPANIWHSADNIRIAKTNLANAWRYYTDATKVIHGGAA